MTVRGIISKRCSGKTTMAIERSKSFDQVYVITNSDGNKSKWLASANLVHPTTVTIIAPDDDVKINTLFQDKTAFTVFECDLAVTSFYKDHEEYLQQHLLNPDCGHCLILAQTERRLPEWLRPLVL